MHLWPLGLIAGLWTISDLGYYFLLPALGVSATYNDGSVAITLYYVFWVGTAIITFWPVYRTWPTYGAWSTFDDRITSYIVWSVSFAGCILFAAYVLPRLPQIHWSESWTPPDVVLASTWYFLPKSMEILYQQLLVLALVLVLSEQQYSLWKMSFYCAVLFGATHVLLVFGGVPIGYVARFTVAASAFGLLFPYLLLRVRNGFAFSYMIHWLYYALSVIMPHLFLSPTR